MLEIGDERAIHHRLLQYAVAADTRDRNLMEACFTADLVADYGAGIGRFTRRADLVDRLMTMLGGLGPTLHFVTNIMVDAAQRGARARSYTQAVILLPGNPEPIRSAGTYDDLLVPGPDGWRISERIYTPLGEPRPVAAT